MIPVAAMTHFEPGAFLLWGDGRFSRGKGISSISGIGANGRRVTDGQTSPEMGAICYGIIRYSLIPYGRRRVESVHLCTCTFAFFIYY